MAGTAEAHRRDGSAPAGPPHLRDPAAGELRASLDEGVVTLEGELDMATAHVAELALSGAREIGGAGPLGVDLRELAFVDCAGVRVLVEGSERARRAGRQLVLIPGTGGPARLLRLLGLDDMLKLGPPSGGERAEVGVSRDSSRARRLPPRNQTAGKHGADATAAATRRDPDGAEERADHALGGGLVSRARALGRPCLGGRPADRVARTGARGGGLLDRTRRQSRCLPGRAADRADPRRQPGPRGRVWRAKHNHAHHSFTNVVGADTDIDQLPLARFAPNQSRRGFHRFQHVYMWLLYGLYALKHHLVGDVQEVVTGSPGPTRMARPRGLDLAVYLGGKVAFWGWALAVPLLLHPWWAVLAVFLMSSWVLGFTLAVTFQLAHCVEEADFASVEGLRAGPRREWAVHQVESIVDFANANPLLGWYLGGLNFQIEHHLLPRVCHVHYRRLAPVVQAICAEHGVRHTAQATLRGALGSHGRWLRRMGRVPEVPALAA